jgi:hypothetical protein
MRERLAVVSLTRLAFLNALALSFLSLQYVFPASFLVSLWVIPVVFALEIILCGPRDFLLSAVLMAGLGFIFFGLPTGCWTIVYLAIGGVIGLLYRHKIPWFFRILLGILAYGLALTGIVAIFLILLGLTTVDISALAEQISPALSWQLASGIALFVSAIVLVSMIDYSVDRVCKHLSFETG